MTEGIIIAIFGGTGVILAEMVKMIVEHLLAKKGRGISALQTQMDEGMEKMNRKIDEGFADVDHRLREITFDMELDRTKDARIRILRYADEIMEGREHSKESFDQTLIDIDTYEDYCRIHQEFENNRTTLATQRIRDVYKKLLKENAFLK